VAALQGEGTSYLELAAQAAKLREKVSLMAVPRQSLSSQHQHLTEATAEPGPQSPTRTNGDAVRSRSPHYDLIGKQNPQHQHQHQHQQEQQQLWPGATTAAAAASTATAGRATSYGGGEAMGMAAVPRAATADRAGSAPVDWHAALQSKLLPYDVVRTRESLIDAAATLWVQAPPGVYAAAPPQPVSGGGGGTQSGTTMRQSRGPSPSGIRPAMRRSSMGAGIAPAAGITEGAAARSAPVTPRRANSPARSSLAPPPPPQQQQQPQPYGRNAAVPSKSPRVGRAGSSGSILDRATPHPSGGGAAGNIGGGGGGGSRSGGSPQPMRPASPVPSEPITIVRPFAWQERETRLWLDELGLAVTSAEESLPLLDNPLRNGLLLAALAARVVGSPLPNGVVTDPPRDVRSARTNILCALDHLGLLAAPWGPPPDAERRARAQAATASDIGSGGTAGNTTASGGGGGGGGASSGGSAAANAGGRSRSPSPARNAAKGPTTGSSGIIAIKALGSAGRGYALRLKERQLRAGLGLIAEVESVLAGSADSIWGLLNFIRLAVAPHYLHLRGSGNGAASTAAAASRRPWGNAGPLSDEPVRRTFDVRGGVGPDGTTGLGPAPTVVAAAVAAANDPPTSRSGRTSPGRTAGATVDEGGSQPAGVTATAPSPCLRGGGKVAVVGGGRNRVTGGPVADPRGSSHLAANGNGHASGTSSSATGGAVTSPAATENGLLYRPLWPTLAALPYGPVEVAALESSLLQWLQEAGAISRREAAQGFSAMLPMFEDGTFICWLVSNLGRKPIVGAHRRPLTEAARRTNWLKAIEAMRTIPGMSRRFLAYEEALIHCERPLLTGLLEDLHRLAGGMPPAPSKILPDAKPYLPYLVPEPVVRTLPPEHIAVNCSSVVSSPTRTPTPRRASTGAMSMGGPCAAMKSIRSTPSASSPTGTPNCQRQGSSGAAASGGLTPPPQHQQHPLFQKAAPLSSGDISSAVERKDKEETRRDGADAAGAATRDIAVSAADGSGEGSRAWAGGSELNTPREAYNNSPCRNNSQRGGRNAAAAVVAASARCAAAAAAAAAGAAGTGSTGGAGRGLITDIMVTPSKVLPPDQQQRGMRRPASATAIAADTLRGSYPIAAWGHDGMDVRQSLPGGTTGNNGHNHQCHHQKGKPLRSSSVRGSRSVGGALEACSSSPAISPRLRLVPSAL
ncbi:hypothetical protein Vafri_20588, partial [Volvox africanus]